MEEAREWARSFQTDKENVFEFMIIYARFEFALKSCGFVMPTVNWAKPDWEKYSATLKPFFPLDDPILLEAVKYYLTYPPLKQMRDTYGLVWADVPRGKNENETTYVIRLLNHTRNNLFHGGKFNVPIDEVSRNSKLLNYSITILGYCLSCSPNVSEAFYSESDI